MSELTAPSNVSDDQLRRTVRIINKRSKKTDATVMRHVKHCERLQRWGLRVGMATLVWLVTHSPEAAKMYAEIVKNLP